MKQVQAEKKIRELVLNTEGFKQASKLKSEGNVIKMTNKAKAEANAEVIIKQAHATSNAIDIIAKSLMSDNSKETMFLHLTKEQIEMQGKIDATSNTIFFF